MELRYPSSAKSDSYEVSRIACNYDVLQIQPNGSTHLTTFPHRLLRSSL
jgi:hypothetical protein